MRESGTFCVNVLAADQVRISARMAGRGTDKFAGLDWRPSPVTGSPVLSGALAYVDCRVQAVHEAGDHFVVIGHVLDLDVLREARPLVFFQGRYGTAADLR
jgi:3-hydroxy-9,10-secoandrosta-1,3,5(10)-triene-9,17-dione monooxygenase reductase component